MATAILLLGIFLAATGSFLVQRWQSGSARRQSLSFEDQLGIVANTAGLIVITWWVMSLTIAVAAALLDRLGRTRAAAATGRFSPAFMRRLVLAAVGLQLLTAPLATRGDCARRARSGPARPGSGVGIVDTATRAGPGAGATRSGRRFRGGSAVEAAEPDRGCRPPGGTPRTRAGHPRRPQGGHGPVR